MFRDVFESVGVQILSFQSNNFLGTTCVIIHIINEIRGGMQHHRKNSQRRLLDLPDAVCDLPNLGSSERQLPTGLFSTRTRAAVGEPVTA